MRRHKKHIWYINGWIAILALAVLLTGLTGCSGTAAEVAVTEESDAAQESSQDTTAIGYVYGIPMDENAGVITENVADIYSSPDVKSDRITQALYNQPVSILQQEPGWARVAAVDGSIGWMKLKYIDRDVSSIYGKTYNHRIIVTSREKTVHSGPSGGVTYVEAPMGCEFLSFNSSGDAYEVFLPGGKTGWIKGSGMIHIGQNQAIPVTNAEDFAATALRLKGASYLLNGMSGLGIDAHGLVYICARINGVALPRSLAGQLSSGTEIAPEEARAGDLVFLAGIGEGEEETVTCVGVGIGSGNYLYAGRKSGYVAIGDLKKDNPEGRIVAARRIFN